MRETDKICQEMFNGNMDEAIWYIIQTYGGGKLAPFIDEWTPEEARLAEDLILSRGKSNNNDLTITNEEVANAKIDQTKAKIGKDLLKLIIGNASIIGLSALLASTQNLDPSMTSNIATGLTSIFTTCVALDAGSNIVNYFQYKQAKKKLEKNQDSPQIKK